MLWSFLVGFALFVFGIGAEEMIEPFLFVPRRVGGYQIRYARIQPPQYRQVVANEDGSVLAVHLWHKCVQFAVLPKIFQSRGKWLGKYFIPIL